MIYRHALLAEVSGVVFSNLSVVVQIVPVIPFALTSRVGVPEEDGTSKPCFSFLSLVSFKSFFFSDN